jgi:glycerophosphoryl diester phosphodiesterase
MPVNAPVLLAHRGWASRYPENTRVGIEAALRIGVPAVELDVQLSADGVPVVIHDPSLQRTAGDPRRVSALSASELATISVHEPARLGTRFADVPVPLLVDIVGLLEEWPRARAFVEIKRESAESHGVDETVAVIMDVLSPVRDRCVVISFVERAVITARHLGAIATGWVLNHYDHETRRLADAMAPDYLICDYRKFPAPPASLWSGPWRWGSYEITNVTHALTLVERGVHVIESMAAGELAEDPRLNPGCPVGNSA